MTKLAAWQNYHRFDDCEAAQRLGLEIIEYRRQRDEHCGRLPRQTAMLAVLTTACETHSNIHTAAAVVLRSPAKEVLFGIGRLGWDALGLPELRDLEPTFDAVQPAV